MKKLSDKVNKICLEVDKEETEKLLIAFDKFLTEIKETNYSMLPEYKIAEYCLILENKRYNRVDVLTIHSEPKHTQR